MRVLFWRDHAEGSAGVKILERRKGAGRKAGGEVDLRLCALDSDISNNL